MLTEKKIKHFEEFSITSKRMVKSLNKKITLEKTFGKTSETADP